MPARERGVGLVDRVKATERVRERERGGHGWAGWHAHQEAWPLVETM